MDINDRIKEIEEELKRTPYNKATQHHIGKLKAKLAELKEKAMVKKSKRRGFGVKKSGDATVVMVGFPSVGKSTLLNKLTNARSNVGDYDFTTINVIPGAMRYKSVNIQLLDLPGVVENAAVGKGHGKEVLSIVRNSDLVLTVIDVKSYEKLEMVREELYKVGMRLDKNKPRVVMKKNSKGGIKVQSSVDLKITSETIREILNINGIHNADVVINENINEDQLIDVVMGNRVYIPSLVILNKIDTIGKNDLKSITKNLNHDFVAVSALLGRNLDELRERIYEKLNFVRVYMKPRSGEFNMEEPLIIKKGSTIADICDKLHKGLRKSFKYALVWGTSVKHRGQRKGLKHVLEDEDVVTIVTKR